MAETKKKRLSQPGVRHRIDNGPNALEIVEAPLPDLKKLGTLSRFTHEIIEGGPRAIIAAEHKAAKLAKKFGIDIEEAWCLTTPYIEERKHTPTGRYALQWRPRFLAVLSLSRSMPIAAKAARVPYNTPKRHRERDPDFDKQCLMAEEHAIELLHDVTMKSAIEGDLEPVYWQGVRVGFVRKIDNRLRIEMLRAHMPKTFKMPGSKVAINTGTIINGNAMIVDSDEQDRLIGLRQDSLRRMADRKKQPLLADAEVVG